MNFLMTSKRKAKKEGIKRDIEKYPNSPFKALSVSKEIDSNVNGLQIKGEDVLLQQEADANGLVWETSRSGRIFWSAQICALSSWPVRFVCVKKRSGLAPAPWDM